MIDYERAKELAVAASVEDECASEFRAALSGLVAVATEPGRFNIHEALRIYRIKAWSAQRAGVDTHGVDRTLERLAQRNEDEVVLLYLFEDSLRRYFLFVLEENATLIGCMSVPRRFPDPNVDWSAGAPVLPDAKEK